MHLGTALLEAKTDAMAPTRVALSLSLLILLHLLQLSRRLTAIKLFPDSKCPEQCGNLPLPFPFGIGPRCSRDRNFNVYCDETTGNAYLFSNNSNIRIKDVLSSEGQIRILKRISSTCYNDSGSMTSEILGQINLWSSNYKFSDARNEFTAIGCNTIALIVGARRGLPFTSGCASVCVFEEAVADGNCTGMGCCQTPIPSGLKFYDVSFFNLANLSQVRAFNPCSYAFLGEIGSYTFNKSDLESDNLFTRYQGSVPTVLDWVVASQTCEKAKNDITSYACVSGNSECIDIKGDGYRCNCSSGYEGNPYLKDGCHDIDECGNKTLHNCSDICVNLPGSHSCECHKGAEFEPGSTSQCREKDKKHFPALPLALGLSIGVSLLLILGSWINWGFQKRKLLISRQNFFEQNGGLLLRREIASMHGSSFKIFTLDQIERATNKFDKDMILGQGGQGTVYRGNLEDNRVVAIKRCRIIDESQRDEFAREMLILSQINHRNVVKLLGCCLEVDIPILVYEFISNGTLFHYIHGGEVHKSAITFFERLGIATQAAEALNYLHAEASPPIVHGDVKSTNILLDENFMVKISDFGASKLTPMDKDQFVTLVQGTYGYLDPESLQTHQLTTKSDVYSFGVVLAELLTRKKALYSEGSEKQRSLAKDFVSSAKNNDLPTILDDDLVNEGPTELLREMVKITCRCLGTKGEERPTMKEVAMELEGIRRVLLAQGVAYHANETEPLLGEPSYSLGNNTSTNFRSNNVFGIEGGR